MRLLVVGASSGIGRSVALLAARDGIDVVAAARRAERLDELPVPTVVCDARKAEDCETVVAFAVARVSVDFVDGREKLGDIEADPACAYDRNLFAGISASLDDVDVACDFRMVDAGNRRPTRDDAGRHDHFVEIAQIVGNDTTVQLDVDAEPRESHAEIAQRFLKFFLAGNAPCQIELAAYLAGGFV